MFHVEQMRICGRSAERAAIGAVPRAESFHMKQFGSLNPFVTMHNGSTWNKTMKRVSPSGYSFGERKLHRKVSQRFVPRGTINKIRPIQTKDNFDISTVSR